MAQEEEFVTDAARPTDRDERAAVRQYIRFCADRLLYQLDPALGGHFGDSRSSG